MLLSGAFLELPKPGLGSSVLVVSFWSRAGPWALGSLDTPRISNIMVPYS